jgi:hypothetical protein
MTMREQVILRVLEADSSTLKSVLKTLRKRRAASKKGKRAVAAKPFKPIACGSWKGKLPDVSSVEWVNRMRATPRWRR